MTKLPILGQPSPQVAIFCVAGVCPVCGAPIMGHGQTPGEDAAVYPTCHCRWPATAKVELRIPQDYDADFERTSVDLLMERVQHLLSAIGILARQQNLPRIIEATGETVADAADNPEIVEDDDLGICVE